MNHVGHEDHRILWIIVVDILNHPHTQFYETLGKFMFHKDNNEDNIIDTNNFKQCCTESNLFCSVSRVVERVI